MNNKILKGIHKVSLKWNKICMENPITKDTEFFSDLDFKALLLQSFDCAYRDKILEAIYSNKTLIIDFDNEEVNIVIDKDYKYIECMKPSFSASYIESQTSFDSFEILPFDYYSLN